MGYFLVEMSLERKQSPAPIAMPVTPTGTDAKSNKALVAAVIIPRFLEQIFKISLEVGVGLEVVVAVLFAALLLYSVT